MAYEYKYLETLTFRCATLDPMPSGTKTVPRSADLAVALILAAEKRRQGMTQETLARMVGVSQSQVSRVLGGHKPMTMGEMFRMCKALGLVASDVVEQADRETRAR
jgi:antitoxin component HigA of HigAB toxin-antitoxin module